MRKLKGIYTILPDDPEFNDEDYRIARRLAVFHPYNIHWDVFDGDMQGCGKMADQYKRLYGEEAFDLLVRKEMVVVSHEQKWVPAGARFIPEDPVPQPVAGPGQEVIATPFGQVVRDRTIGNLTVIEFRALMEEILGGPR